MPNSDPKSHWKSLAESLGAEIEPDPTPPQGAEAVPESGQPAQEAEAVAHPEPEQVAADDAESTGRRETEQPVVTHQPVTKPKPQERTSPPRKRSHWSSLLGALGLEVPADEPAQTGEEPAEQEPALTDEASGTAGAEEDLPADGETDQAEDESDPLVMSSENVIDVVASAVVEDEEDEERPRHRRRRGGRRNRQRAQEASQADEQVAETKPRSPAELATEAATQPPAGLPTDRSDDEPAQDEPAQDEPARDERGEDEARPRRRRRGRRRPADIEAEKFQEDDLLATEDSAESDEEDEADEDERPRRRRRRRGRGRSSESGNAARTAATESDLESDLDFLDEAVADDEDEEEEQRPRRSRRRRGRRRPAESQGDSEDASTDAEVESRPRGEASGDEGDEEEERPRRRRRRRGRRSSETAIDAAATDDDTADLVAGSEVAEEDDIEEEERPRRRRRRGRSKRESVERVSAGENDDDPDDQSLDEESSPELAHRKLPSWAEAIDVIVQSNLTARSKSRGSRGGGRRRSN